MTELNEPKRRALSRAWDEFGDEDTIGPDGWLIPRGSEYYSFEALWWMGQLERRETSACRHGFEYRLSDEQLALNGLSRKGRHVFGPERVVVERKVRSTGVVVQLVDRGGSTGWGDWRWETICAEHGGVCSHETQRLARDFVSRPEEWCEDCQAEHGGDPMDDEYVPPVE